MPRTVSSPGLKSHGFYGRRGFQEAQAVTALHCLVPSDVPNMHLLLGYDRGSWHDHLQPVNAVSASSPGDIAILCLDRPSTVEPVPTAVRPADRGEAVLVVGYGKPRVQVATRAVHT